MSEEETFLLDPPQADDDPEDAGTQKTRDELYIRVFYTLSLLASIGGFGCGVWGYIIVLNAPFDEYSKKTQRQGYETNFVGMQSVLVFLGINIIWSTYNLRLALKGRQNDIWPLNMVYDFGIWGCIIAFGVLNMIMALWDRRLCDGWGDNKEVYKKCDIQMFRLLVVELVAINLGLLVAVLHFILLVARCCTQGRRNDITISKMLRRQIHDEEQILLGLVERRVQLLRENEELEARSRGERPLLALQDEVEVDSLEIRNEEQHTEEDLIDIANDETSPL